MSEQEQRAEWVLDKWREAECRWKEDREALLADNQRLKEYSAQLYNQLIRERDKA